MNETRCAACDAPLDDDAIFCNECGQTRPAVVVASTPSSPRAEQFFSAACPKCGTPVDNVSRFCSQCAYDLSAKPVMDQTKLTCPGCQKFYLPNDRFCRHCAFDLSTFIRGKESSAHFCTKCGKPFVATDKFCRHCAADISESNSTVAVPIINRTAVPEPSPHLSSARVPVSTSPRSGPNPTQGTNKQAQNPSGPHWISPSAAAFVVICFFLPWIEWSCFGANVPVSGAQLADRDASFWIFPLAAVTSIATYFIFRAQNSLWKARPYILSSSAIGLLLLLYKVSSVPSAEIFGTRISASDLGFKPQIGGFGTVIGYVLAMIGCAFMNRSPVGDAISARGASFGDIAGWFNPDSPHLQSISPTFGDRIRGMRSNKAALLCYLGPLVIPIFFQYGFLLLATTLGIPAMALLGAALGLVSYFAVQTLFLKMVPHSENLLVRFHAFQSIFQILCGWGIMLVLFGLTYMSSTGPGDVSQGAKFLLILVYVVGIASTILSIVLCIKSNRAEMFKVPLIGDWALNWASRSVTSINNPPDYR